MLIIVALFLEVNMLSVSCRWLKGDINAFKVLDCLSRIASLYGEQFIIIQYIKHIADLVRGHIQSERFKNLNFKTV